MLLEWHIQKDECIFKLETIIEHLGLVLDSAGQTIENLKIWVCCCNKNIAKIINERDSREESVAPLGLEYMTESGEEEEFRTLPGDLMTMVLDTRQIT